MTLRSRVAAIMVCLATFLFLLTFSFALPIYIRPFYYAQIEPLKLEERSGYSRQEILDAYNEVLDYLTLPGKEFGTGVLPHSASGRDHFVDCKFLFDLNAWVLLGSGATLAGISLLRRKGLLGELTLAGRSPGYWAGICAVVLAVVAVLNFEQAFVIFHKLLFPGKYNWIFNWYDDPIIRILPSEFFLNCAILIGSSITLITLGLLVSDRLRRKKRK